MRKNDGEWDTSKIILDWIFDRLSIWIYFSDNKVSFIWEDIKETGN